MTKNESKIDNKELFTLFNTVQDFEHVYNSIEKLIPKGLSLEMLFKKFSDNVNIFDGFPILNICLFTEYVFAHVCSNSKMDSFDMDFSQITSENYIEYISDNPSKLIFSFYTLEYFHHKNRFFKYSDLITLNGSSSSFQVNKKDKLGNIYYKLANSDALLKKASNITRPLQNVKNNLFIQSINMYFGDDVLPNVYHINGFLHGVSCQLAKNTNKLSCKHKLENPTAENLLSFMESLINVYFETTKELLTNPQNKHIGILFLILHKIEYTFGIMSLFNTLDFLLPINKLYEISADSRITDSQFTMLLENLSNAQNFPCVYTRFRYGSKTTRLNDMSDITTKNIIAESKIFATIIYYLYRKDIKNLRKELCQEIERLYFINLGRISPAIVHVNNDSFPYNGFDTYFKMNYNILNPDSNYQKHCQTYIRLFIKTLSSKQVGQFSKFLYERYSSDWFENKHNLFSQTIKFD